MKDRVIRAMLNTAGISMIMLSAYYFVQVIFYNRWLDTSFRTVQILLFIGGVAFLALSKILKGQETIKLMSQVKNSKLELFIKVALNTAGIVMLVFSAYHFFQVILEDLWFDVQFRTVQILMFIGGVAFLAFGKILKGQGEVMHTLGERDGERDGRSNV